MDRFKQYLQEHASELDTDLPREAVWQRIQQQSAPAPKVRRLYWPVAAAACLAAIIGISTWWFWTAPVNKGLAYNPPAITTQDSQPSTETHIPVAEETTAQTAPTTMHPKREQGTKHAQAGTGGNTTNTSLLAAKHVTDAGNEAPSGIQLETGLIHIINLQLEKVRSTPIYSENAAYFSSFKKEFNQLNEEERTWKKKASNGNVTEEQLEELINIYQQKLTVLKLLQNEISKTNKHFKQKHNQATQHAAFMDI
ncbi:hypothetical protein SAMN05421788_103366 [Filimonas lacunae]|uniref:Uncharacterized protein n=1 Tax=Filimonas lacunae TaxID=477680 RepID=A0A173MKM1_9BACT|nr:hypothetical protein [Filimonas lacunae]BAV08026.1 hypothetical protein FLA_4059 [Filimonas lacunae]SIT08191.1 hypothetical protein SAMN05421788_103366 [Filimonas lacunae]